MLISNLYKHIITRCSPSQPSLVQHNMRIHNTLGITTIHLSSISLRFPISLFQVWCACIPGPLLFQESHYFQQTFNKLWFFLYKEFHNTLLHKSFISKTWWQCVVPPHAGWDLWIHYPEIASHILLLMFHIQWSWPLFFMPPGLS